MQLNSPEQLDRARRVLAHFNYDWEAMLKGAELLPGGIVRLKPNEPQLNGHHVHAPAPVSDA